jgi:hypothetical protein
MAESEIRNVTMNSTRAAREPFGAAGWLSKWPRDAAQNYVICYASKGVLAGCGWPSQLMT